LSGSDSDGLLIRTSVDLHLPIADQVIFCESKTSQPCLATIQVTKQQPSLSAFTMADRRPDEQEMSRPKKPRTDDLDPASNPYLKHMYDETRDNSNGYASRKGYGNGASTSSLSNFKRHHTTALQAHAAEDGPNNPFNNAPLSKQYFDILKTRRELPVHKQR
jgi:hypothetical protein